MSEPAFEPPSEPPASPHPPPWRRILGLALDVLIVLIVLESWELPFVELTGWIDGGPPVISNTPTGPRGFGLSGRGGQIIGLGATGLAIALQIPFAWRSSTLGLSLFGLELRSDGRRAAPYLFAPWTLGAWGLSMTGLIAAITTVAAVTRLDTAANTLALAVVVGGLAGANLLVGVRSRRSLLDRLLGVYISYRDAPVEQPAADHVTGWRPRPDFVPHRPRAADKDLHAWRSHASPDPLNPIWGPDPGPMLESPEDPEHVEVVSADDPFAAIGGHTDTGAEDAALAERLRRALTDPDGQT
jgi:hypothetical protein